MLICLIRCLFFGNDIIHEYLQKPFMTYNIKGLMSFADWKSVNIFMNDRVQYHSR